MPNITKDLAEDIATKLNRDKPKKKNTQPFSVEIKHGAKHILCKVLYGTVFIDQFGIQRGSKKTSPHNYVADQLHLTRSEGYNLAKCPLSVDGFIELLKQRGHVAPDEDDEEGDQE
jgi:hypothetical protein